MTKTSLITLLSFFFLALAGCNGEEQSTSGSKDLSSTSDYMAPEVREKVEALKSAVNETPTNEDNATERAKIVFEWINALARKGEYIPVNATSVVAQINAYGIPSGPALDTYIRELTVMDERPDAIGTLRVEPDKSFEVRSHATFKQVYTVGNANIEEGGGFLVAKHFQTNHGIYQTDEPTAANFVSIDSDNSGVEFEVDSFDVPGMHGGFRGASAQLVFRVADGTLRTGDNVTITYGDTTGGGPGLLMPNFSSDQMPFPVYVDLDGSDLWLSLPIQPVRLHGSEIAGVAGFAPSIVEPGEAFELSIRAEDDYGNRATGTIPTWELYDGDTLIRTIEASNNAAILIENLSFDDPGVHRITIKAKDGPVTGATNPILVEENPENRIYWGDTHGHSGFAEGIGSADAFMRFARDDARLDFVTHSEHDIWMDDAEWQTLTDLVRKYTTDGEFIPFLGYEWTVRTNQGGHHNVLFRTPDNRERVPSQLYPVLSSLYQGLRSKYDVEDVLIIPHAHQRGEYRQSDPAMEHLIEIMSMHGTFEWFGRMYLNHGHHVGFVAASDDHIGRPGYAKPKSTSLAQRNGLGAVLAREKSVDGLFDAMKSLHAYATTGERIVLDLNVNGTGIGQRASFSNTRKIEGRVIGTAPIKSVTLFRNDRAIRTWTWGEPQDNTLAISFYSDSYPFHPIDNPRGWRHWRGTIEIDGSSLDSASASDHVNRITQELVRDDDNPNLLHFATNTRGDYSTLFLKFRALNPETTIRINLEDAGETGSGPPQLRRHQMIPGSKVELAVSGMADGKLVKDMSVDGYDDAIILERGSAAPEEVEFQYTDEEKPRHGDYYFIRVRQMNDAMAWSSPIWVGGYPPE